MHRHLTRLLVAAAVASSVFVAACGSDDDESGGTAATATPAKKYRAAMVTDIGGLNDRSFNQSAYEGLKRAEKELGVEIRAVSSSQNSDYVPNLSSLARQGYDIIFAVGFLMFDTTEKMAKAFPDQKWAIIDGSQKAMKSKPQNVRGLLFREAEAGYLVGYLAGLFVKDQGGKQVVSSVGGQKLPAVDAYIAGFQAGAKKANPQVKTLNGYSQDFVDQAKCKEIALNQIAEGSQVVFQVAGQCGLGALDAAKTKNVHGIGVDADQGYLGDHILTSALKKIDEAVFAVIKEGTAGGVKTGIDTIFDVKSGGVGFGKLSADAQKYEQQLEEVQHQIASREIADIPSTIGN